MDLVTFSVTNYRSITSACKLPLKGVTVLIGPNNEGKSNILRALVTSLQVLQTFRQPWSSPAQRALVVRDYFDWSRDFPVSLQGLAATGKKCSFDLEFRLTDKEVDEFYSEVNSTLNGTLPIQISLSSNDVYFKVMKKGPGGPALSKKAPKIATFVAKRININYIPVTRTSDAAERIVSRMVDQELQAVENNEAFRSALAAVAKLQEPVLNKISTAIGETLKQFLPNVKKVNVSIPPQERSRALRRSCEIIVDDGTPTQLSRKGDGVQSLAALSLMRHASLGDAKDRQLVLAIEEPESHLHPSAIHQLKTVISDIAKTHQVIMTTHCPIFVDRVKIKSNIIVSNNKANAAKNVMDIRKVLGVRASDNLQQAELVLVVEGEEDRRALRPILGSMSKMISSALAQGSLGIESLQGGSNLTYKLSQIREALCTTHCFLDYDQAGKAAFDKASAEGLADIGDVNFATCPGLVESELEDLYDTSIYEPLLINRYGVSLNAVKVGTGRKWSDRLATIFKSQGKPWSDAIKRRLKGDIVELVEANAATAVLEPKKGALAALVTGLENKLMAIAGGKA